MVRRRSRGALESAVLKALWDAGCALSAREVRERVGGEGEAAVPALTTVLTVLDRLRVKGLVTKAASAGGGQAFSAVMSESGFTADAMVSTLLAAADREAALLLFARRLDERDLDVLRQGLAGHGGSGASDAGESEQPQ